MSSLERNLHNVEFRGDESRCSLRYVSICFRTLCLRATVEDNYVVPLTIKWSLLDMTTVTDTRNSILLRRQIMVSRRRSQLVLNITYIQVRKLRNPLCEFKGVWVLIYNFSFDKSLRKISPYPNIQRIDFVENSNEKFITLFHIYINAINREFSSE